MAVDYQLVTRHFYKKDFVLSAQSDGFEYAERLTDKTQLQKTIKEFYWV